MVDQIVDGGWHWSFGWLRRPELDDENGYCYEEPDGDLVYSGRPCHKRAMYLDVRLDDSTGERYLCLARLPRTPRAKALR
jgi:hypothetical protein